MQLKTAVLPDGLEDFGGKLRGTAPTSQRFLQRSCRLLKGESRYYLLPSYIFIDEYGAGETVVHVHRGNCSEQTKNGFVRWHFVLK